MGRRSPGSIFSWAPYGIARFNPMTGAAGTKISTTAKPNDVIVRSDDNVYFTDPADPDGQPSVARVGNESVDSTIEPGDKIQLEYLVGQVVKVTRVVPVA